MQRRVVDYTVELPITFEHGTGATQAVSREEVSFITDALLVAGQQLAGYLRLPAGEDEVGATLRYIARVTYVRRPSGGDEGFEVRARFKELDFVPGGAA